MKAAEAQREKMVGDVVRENRSLVGPLSKVRGRGGVAVGGGWPGGKGRGPGVYACMRVCLRTD